MQCNIEEYLQNICIIFNILLYCKVIVLVNNI